MKIIIKENKDKRGLRFHFPLFIVKTRMFSRFISKKNKEFKKKTYEEYRAFIKPAFKELKRYIRAKGHFYLVEIESAEGEIIKIKV